MFARESDPVLQGLQGLVAPGGHFLPRVSSTKLPHHDAATVGHDAEHDEVRIGILERHRRPGVFGGSPVDTGNHARDLREGGRDGHPGGLVRLEGAIAIARVRVCVCCVWVVQNLEGTLDGGSFRFENMVALLTAQSGAEGGRVCGERYRYVLDGRKEADDHLAVVHPPLH